MLPMPWDSTEQKDKDFAKKGGELTGSNLYTLLNLNALTESLPIWEVQCPGLSISVFLSPF